MYTTVAGAGFLALVPALGVTLLVMATGTAAFLAVMAHATKPRFP